MHEHGRAGRSARPTRPAGPSPARARTRNAPQCYTLELRAELAQRPSPTAPPGRGSHGSLAGRRRALPPASERARTPAPLQGPWAGAGPASSSCRSPKSPAGLRRRREPAQAEVDHVGLGAGCTTHALSPPSVELAPPGRRAPGRTNITDVRAGSEPRRADRTYRPQSPRPRARTRHRYLVGQGQFQLRVFFRHTPLDDAVAQLLPRRQP